MLVMDAVILADLANIHRVLRVLKPEFAGVVREYRRRVRGELRVDERCERGGRRPALHRLADLSAPSGSERAWRAAQNSKPKP